MIVELQNGQVPFGTLQTESILTSSFTGTNLVTGQTQQLTITDPDSLKLLPNGDLLLTGEGDGTYVFVKNPGTPQQTESFVTLPSGDVPDDAIMPTSRSGTFYIALAYVYFEEGPGRREATREGIGSCSYFRPTARRIVLSLISAAWPFFFNHWATSRQIDKFDRWSGGPVCPTIQSQPALPARGLACAQLAAWSPGWPPGD